MPIFDSSQRPVDPWLAEQWYNSLDCCVTHEIMGKLSAEHGDGPNAKAGLIYDFERAMQGPALDMMLRGFRIDPVHKQGAIRELTAVENDLGEKLDRLAHGVWGRGLNPRSPDQVKEFFYRALGLPEVWINVKGERKLSANREALEKLSDYYFAQPFIAAIFALRDARKKARGAPFGGQF